MISKEQYFDQKSIQGDQEKYTFPTKVNIGFICYVLSFASILCVGVCMYVLFPLKLAFVLVCIYSISVNGSYFWLTQAKIKQFYHIVKV